MQPGFTVAATAAAAGSQVSLWLTGDAAGSRCPAAPRSSRCRWPPRSTSCCPRCSPRGTVTVCAQCAGRRELSEDDLLPGVRIAGAAVFVDEITRDGVQALVY